MESVGTVNLNVQKEFMKILYKKKKITLQDISLTKQEGPKETHDEILAGEQMVVSNDTLDEESEVEFEA